MAGALQVYGTEKLRLVGKELRLIGGPTSRGIRSNMRKSIVTVAKPIKTEVQAGYRAIPASGASTGLREQLANATQIQIRATARTALVRVWVNPARMPAGKGVLIGYMEGLRPWNHPVYGNREHWVTQAAHPTFYRIARPRAEEARGAVVAAIRTTLNQLPRNL